MLQMTADTALRGSVTPTGTQVFSVYDFINLAYGKDLKNAYARVTLSNLVSDGSKHQDEVVKNLYYLKFPGNGQRETPAMTIRGLQRLLMILPGKIGEEFRKLAEGTFTRVMAGDTSVVEEIHANAASDAPIHQAYRQALEQEPVVDTQALERKRKFEDMEYQKLATETGLNIVKGIQAVQADTNMDERTRLIMKDYFLNLATQGSGLAIANGEQRESPISLSVVAKDMGHRLTDSQAKKIGIKLKRSYMQTHGQAPPKHDQLVNGRVTRVNSYTTRDLSLVQEVIKAFMDAEQASDEDSDALPY